MPPGSGQQHGLCSVIPLLWQWHRHLFFIHGSLLKSIDFDLSGIAPAGLGLPPARQQINGEPPWMPNPKRNQAI
jgi:hypothetical protein